MRRTLRLAIIWLAIHSNLGTLHLQSTQESAQVGWAILAALGEEPLPAAASALFSFSDDQGVLVWEAGVGAVQASSVGLVPVDEREGRRTGLALVNPSERPVGSRLILRDSRGVEVERLRATFPPLEHRPLFIGELFPGLEEGFLGSLAFETDSPDQQLAAVALRQGGNARGEPIFSTLPALLGGSESGVEEVVFPHIGIGPDLSTQLLLLNPGEDPVSGTVQLVRSDGADLEAEVDGLLLSEFSFDLEPSGVLVRDLLGEQDLQLGYARLIVAEGSAPLGLALFRVSSENALETEAGVGTSPAVRRARLFVDNHLTRVGVALVNSTEEPNRVDFELQDRNGRALLSAVRTLLPEGHLSVFSDELFPELPTGFVGQMEIRASRPVYCISLKLTINARDELVLATLPVADLDRPANGRELIFPQIGFGAGLTTRLILLSGDVADDGPVSLRFFGNRAGEPGPLEVPLGDRAGSEFRLDVPAGGSRGLRPGNSVPAAELRLDPFDIELTEYTLRQDSQLRLSPQVIDVNGVPRDDFRFVFQSLDEGIAPVDERGVLQGAERGFSAVNIRVADLQATAPVRVIEVRSGILSSGKIGGIVQDSAGRIFAVDTTNHVVLLSSGLDSLPELWAGSEGQAGDRNGERLTARFNNPTFAALDQVEGALYISDSGNHAIRVIRTGGQVETLTGTGKCGFRDGPLGDAELCDPRGLTLDSRGGLWIADSGNHVIRRIDFLAGTVTTLAGDPKNPGSEDGSGSRARFDTPEGVAWDSGSFAESGQSLLVADSGNGSLRRVFPDGRVVTLGEVQVPLTSSSVQPFDFEDPTGVAVSPFGFVYVVESSGSVKEIQANRAVSLNALGEEGAVPSAVHFAQSGEVVVGRKDGSAIQVRDGAPRIVRIVVDAPCSNQDDPRNGIETVVLRPSGGQTVRVCGRSLSPQTVVVLSRHALAAHSGPPQELSFEAPPLDSGRTVLTLEHQGGLAQADVIVDSVPPQDLMAGQVTTLAGGSSFREEGMKGPLADVFPLGVELDGSSNLYIVDVVQHRVRRLDLKTGSLFTAVGTGVPGFGGDGGPAQAAQLFNPRNAALGPGGRLYVADGRDGEFVRLVTLDNNVITTFAGQGDINPGCRQQTHPNVEPKEADFFLVTHLAVDNRGNVYISDTNGRQVLRWSADEGTISVFAGGCPDEQRQSSGDGGPATEAVLIPQGVAVGPDGTVYVSDLLNDSVRRVDPETGVIERIAGGVACPDNFGDGGSALEACLNAPLGLALDTRGDLYIADSRHHAIRRVRLSDSSGLIETVAGRPGTAGASFDGIPVALSTLSLPTDVAVDSGGDIYIAESGNRLVLKVDVERQVIRVIAGVGRRTELGDSGPATRALLSAPSGLLVEPDGNLLIADTRNVRVRRVDRRTGVIETVIPPCALVIDPAGEPCLFQPRRMTWGPEGTIFIADEFPHRILRWHPVDGEFAVVAGCRQDCSPNLGDGGPALKATFDEPRDVAYDPTTTKRFLYISDSFNNRIRRIDLKTEENIITTVLGGNCASSGEDCLAQPEGIVLDDEGHLFIADKFGHRVLRFDPETERATPYAGGGTGFMDGRPATAVRIELPTGLARSQGRPDLYIITEPGFVYRVDEEQRIFRVAGVGSVDRDLIGDGGPALEAVFLAPQDLEVDGQGNLYIADTFADRIRFIQRSPSG